MRLVLLTYLSLATSLFACAFDGVVVQKNEEAAPFYITLGIDRIYNFQLRDRQGVVHSQMVPAEVFCRYRVGEYFNEDQAPPSSDGFSKDDGGYVRPPEHHRRHHHHAQHQAAHGSKAHHRLAAKHHAHHPA